MHLYAKRRLKTRTFETIADLIGLVMVAVIIPLSWVVFFYGVAGH